MAQKTPIFNFRNIDNSKSIPSKVFFNHFFALYYFINCDSEKYAFKKIPFYNHISIKNEFFRIEEVKKLLWNSWSTEYAYKVGENIDNAEYYKFSLHWNFPQAYYSAYLSMTAFHETQGIANDQHEKSIKLFSNSVKDGHYPKSISPYAKGMKNEFEYIGFDTFSDFPSDFSALSKIDCLEDAEIQLATFLKTTRKQNAEDKKLRAKKQKDKRFFNAKKEFRKSFTKAHWDLLYSSIPITSIFNLLYRLRIKANYRDVETFINADIDFKLFHKSLGDIISYLNLVHEAYVSKAIGLESYKDILDSFPSHLNDKTAINRFNTIIEKI